MVLLAPAVFWTLATDCAWCGAGMVRRLKVEVAFISTRLALEWVDAAYDVVVPTRRRDVHQRRDERVQTCTSNHASTVRSGGSRP
jgi:hypothetical protein